jgi:large subunit ribosomal protein L10
MKKRQDKIKEVEALRKELDRTQHVFVAGFNKLKVSEDFALRKVVRSAGGKYKVVKNNLIQKATEGTKAQALFSNLSGMTSVAYTGSDPVALAKALTSYAKENPSFVFKAGMVEGRVINIGEINQLALLPSREEMLGRLLFLTKAPAQRLATVINAVGRNLAVVLDQAVKQNKFQG